MSEDTNNDRVKLTETEFGELSAALQVSQNARNEAARAEAAMGTVVRLLSDRTGVDLAGSQYQLLTETHELVKAESPETP